MNGTITAKPSFVEIMVKKIFVDSDVLIDVFAVRRPFYDDSARFLGLAEEHRCEAFTSPLVVANISYVLQKFSNRKTALGCIQKVRTFMGIVDMNEAVVDRALLSFISDFEDALQIYSAEGAEMDWIVTRNLGHYKKSPLSVLSPTEAISVLNQS